MLTFQIGVSNNGPNAATGVVVNDFLVSGQTAFCFDPPDPSPSCTGCTVSQGSCLSPPNGSPGNVSANLGMIPAGGFAQVTITVRVTAAAGTSFTNTASVTSSTTDPNLANNHQTVTVKVVP